MRPDERQVPQLSQPLRGKIHLGYSSGNYIEFIDRLAKLDPEYEELVLESEPHVETVLVESVLRLGVSTVGYLRLAAEFECENSHEIFTALPDPNPHVLAGITVTIRFRQLRELELTINSVSSDHEVLPPSITSTEPHKTIALTWQKCFYSSVDDFLAMDGAVAFGGQAVV